MTKKFIYKRKSSTSIWPVLAFASLTILSAVFKYGIAIKSLKLLAYPNSVIVLAIVTIGWSVYYFLEKKKEKASRANPDYIEVDEKGLRITTPKGEFLVAYSDVEKINRNEEKDDDEASVEITTKESKSYKWEADGFASINEFKEFSQILNINTSTNVN